MKLAHDNTQALFIELSLIWESPFHQGKYFIVANKCTSTESGHIMMKNTIFGRFSQFYTFRWFDYLTVSSYLRFSLPYQPGGEGTILLSLYIH